MTEFGQGIMRLFLLLLSAFSVAFIGGWLSDNFSYPWKHWKREQTMATFFAPPSIAFFLTGTLVFIMMLISPQRQQFTFEQWWCAASFAGLGALSFYYNCSELYSEETLEDKQQKQKMIQEYNRNHG